MFDSGCCSFAVFDDAVLLIECHRCEVEFTDATVFGFDGIRSEVPRPQAIEPGRDPYQTETLHTLGFGGLLLASRSDDRPRGFRGYGNQPDEYCVIHSGNVLIIVSVWAKSKKRGRNLMLRIIDHLSIGEQMGMLRVAA